MLKVSKIAELLELKPAEVNNILTEIGYQKRTGKGYMLLKDRLGEQKLYKDKETGSKSFYVIWKDVILNNKVFLKAVGEYKGTCASVPVITKEEAPKAEKKEFKFDRETFKAEFRTMDGHYVRSKAEVIIDNWLYMNGFVHAYERRVPIVEELYCDFYLPQQQIYIEFWGLEDTKYIERKKKKIALYEHYGLKLIGLTEEDVKNIDDTLPIKLLKHGVSVV